MKSFILITLISIGAKCSYSQFAPPAGQPSSTAIFKDSSIIISWASGCTVVRGYQDISNTSLGFASVGDSSMAIGMAGGSSGVVSLGDGGYCILTFDEPINNGLGWDFAVFENSFSDDFLELAFVEVSSDGINFFRFPATSLTQDTVQVGGFGNIDATKINNLAGKYRAQYGTPFDLDELANQAGLNVNAITHVKVIDVVGCIQDSFATFDQLGNKINDPWNTPFASSGFDLDAVGVIEQSTVSVETHIFSKNVQVFPNPAHTFVTIQFFENTLIQEINLINALGQISTISSEEKQNSQLSLDLSGYQPGMYYLNIQTTQGNITQRLLIQND
mgnify:CR=1 FL=1|tara:strand:- start:6679 stop:7674 length:996 start_codon:yes stop_codon:yes gene_type:complete